MSEMSQVVAALDGALSELYEDVRAQLFAFGDDVREKHCKKYMAFKRLRASRQKNFACVKVPPTLNVVRVYLTLDPKSVRLVPGFVRIARGGTGDVELTLRAPEDLRRAKSLLDRSYHEAGESL